MSKIRKDQLDRWSKFFTEFWKLVKEYRNPDDNEKYWDELINKTSALCNKYAKDGEWSMNGMVVVFCEGLDKEMKNGIHK